MEDGIKPDFRSRLEKSIRMFGKATAMRALDSSERRLKALRCGAEEPGAGEEAAILSLVAPDDGSYAGRECKFTFADLFAGIGGIRLGLESAGGRCAFTSEWNEHAQKTYLSNFKDGHDIYGDITKISAAEIPDHDFLAAGFPCQPFSIAGVSKKNSLGREHGFADKTQGTLFFDVARIIEEKRPKGFLLENVKNLISHDKGRTFSIIRETLEKELGYHIHCKVIDAKAFLPQHRERIFILGFRDPAEFSWDSVILPNEGPKLESILHKEDGSEDEDPRCLGPDGKVLPKFTISDKLWLFLQNYAEKHREAGNGFGYNLVRPDCVSRTLSARYYKDGSEILVYQDGKNPRKLTPRECARLMGFPERFAYSESDMQSYKQFGNSVAVPVIEAIAKAACPLISAT